MCSSCLRHYKRRTRPSFYLGTQYSEIKRRCTHENYGGRKYQGKQFCSREEFINRFVNEPTFLEQYKSWQTNGFKRGDSPSVDRIDNDGDYLISNLQILANKDNGPKDNGNKIVLYLNESEIYFRSQQKLAEYIKRDVATISNILTGKKRNKTGYDFKRL
jgi:hypothetical protein